LDGDDYLQGLRGNDTLYGGPGYDFVSLFDSPNDTIINLALNYSYIAG